MNSIDLRYLDISVNTSLGGKTTATRLDYGINPTTRYWVAGEGYNSLMVGARMRVFAAKCRFLAGTLLTGRT
jgi:hypothetical protein